MAKWINFPVTGGFDNAAPPVADATVDGDNLLLADNIISVSVASTGAGATLQMQATLQLKGLATQDTCVIGIGSSATATYRANAPAVVTAARVKEAINKAITANPGGVKSTVSLPQDSAVNAAYAFGNTLYFKSFVVS
tara:strand:- start:104 stop:517 length:414 start_codon:yes stop_codon:yes gene_type:complete